LRSLREILHQLLCNLPIRRNYAGKYLGQKNSRKERKDAKILKSMKSIKRLIILFSEKEILLNSLHSKKNFASLRTLREIYYIYSSVACLFDATMPEKYPG